MVARRTGRARSVSESIVDVPRRCLGVRRSARRHTIFCRSSLALVLHTASLGVRARVWRDILRFAFPSRVVSTGDAFWAYLAGVGASTIAPLRAAMSFGCMQHVGSYRRERRDHHLDAHRRDRVRPVRGGRPRDLGGGIWRAPAAGEAAGREGVRVQLLLEPPVARHRRHDRAGRTRSYRTAPCRASGSLPVAPACRRLSHPRVSDGFRAPGRASAARRLGAARRDRIRDARRVRDQPLRPLCGAGARRRLRVDRDPVHARWRRNAAGASVRVGERVSPRTSSGIWPTSRWGGSAAVSRVPAAEVRPPAHGGAGGGGRRRGDAGGRDGSQYMGRR